MPTPLLDLLDERVRILERSERRLLAFCVAYVLAGAAASVVIGLLPAAGVLSELKIPTTLAGVGITAFQFPAYVKTRAGRDMLRRLRLEVVAAEQFTPEERQRIIDLAWGTVKEGLAT